MIRLLFIVPYPELREQVEYVLENHPEKNRLDVDIRVMTVEETPDFPADEYDAIIARGYTARKTMKQYEIPTIALSISGYDMIRAVRECCSLYHPKKIAICGFERQLYETRELCEIFHTEACVYAPVRNEELPQIIEEAIRAGCDALIGGYSANLLASRRGLNSVIIRTGESTVAQAVDEAVYTVDRIRQEQIVSQMYKTVVYSSDAGVLYVDRGGTIRVRNRVMRHLGGDVSLMKRPLTEALPWLSGIFRRVRSGGEEENQILQIPGTRTTVSVKCTPVVANREFSGAVFNLTDVTQIQNLESQIRRKLSEKGLKARYTFADILHESREIEETIETARRYAAADSNVIIVGETGTGKELFAQSIHNASSRKNGPFVAINCAALPENLLESELFGYVEGAFTGTSKGGKMGLFEQAHGGTLFLDEIEEISPVIQSKLLRVLQERQVRRIGDNKVIDVNVRVISAINVSLRGLAEQGKFRRDLMYRLDVLRLFLPPLRERGGDVKLLFLYQLGRIRSGLSAEPGALELLEQYPFWGNIRELQNIAERAAVLTTGSLVTEELLRRALYPQDLPATPPAAVGEWTQEQMQESGSTRPEREEERIRRALAQAEGKKAKAAAYLGIDRTTLWRKMKKYGL